MGGFNIPQGMSLADAVKQFRPFAQGGELEQEAPLADMVKSFAASGAMDGGDSSSVDSSSVDSSGRAKPEAPSALQRIDDDPQSRHNTDLTGGGAMNAGDEFENQAPGMATASRASLADQVRQSAAPTKPSFLDGLEAQYNAPPAKQKPMSLAEKIGLAIGAPLTAGLDIPIALMRRGVQQQQQQGEYDQNRARLLPEIMAGERMQQQQSDLDQSENFAVEQENNRENFQRGQSAAAAQNQPFAAWRAQNPNAPVTDWLQAEQNAKPQPKPDAPEQQLLDYYTKRGMSLPEAMRQVKKDMETPQRTPVDEGTWSIQEDAQGNPVEFNSKTGASRPANGVQSRGTYDKAHKGEEAALGAQQYAMDYVKNGAAKDGQGKPIYTGPGDEALMEKFFEMAKPSSGFRMTQQQMDMLKNAQSWMNSLTAKARHAWSGTWFSDEQRQQIAQTMAQLGRDKQPQQQSGGGSSQGSSNSLKTNQALSLDEARSYLQRAGGDKNKARQLAKQDGRTF